MARHRFATDQGWQDYRERSLRRLDDGKMTVPKADLKGGRRRPQAAAGCRLARDIVVEVDASEDGRIPAKVLFDASAMVR